MYHVDSSSPLRRSVFLESLSPASLPQSFRCILLLTKNFTSMRGIGHHRTNNLDAGHRSSSYQQPRCGASVIIVPTTSMRGIGHHRTNNLLLYLKQFAEIWK